MREIKTDVDKFAQFQTWLLFAWGENSEEWDIGRLTQVDSEEVGLDTVEVEEGSRGEEEVGTD